MKTIKSRAKQFAVVAKRANPYSSAKIMNKGDKTIGR